ncbi:MAG: hypothetical protein WAL94_04285, partial [Bacteroidales bacterium]
MPHALPLRGTASPPSGGSPACSLLVHTIAYCLLPESYHPNPSCKTMHIDYYHWIMDLYTLALSRAQVNNYKKNNMDISEIRSKHKLLKRWDYTWVPLSKGYTDKTLYVNVGTLEIKEKDVPPVMKEKFIGGKGYGLRYLWDATTPQTKW